MKISMDFLERRRGEYIYDVTDVDLPENFMDLRGYEQMDFLENLGLVANEVVHRSDFEIDNAWVSEA